MADKTLIRTIDLWIAVGTDDARAVKGAFTDGMHISGKCAYDRYKIVKNCNFMPSITEDNRHIITHLRPKQTAVIFYDNDVAVRLLVLDGKANLQSMIKMAMTECIDNTSLQCIINQRTIKSSEIDLNHPMQEFIPSRCYQPEIDVFSCNRWSLFQAALVGEITDQPTAGSETRDAIPELEYYPDIWLSYKLTTDTEHFKINHIGAFCDKDRTYMVVAQAGSSLAPF